MIWKDVEKYREGEYYIDPKDGEIVHIEYRHGELRGIIIRLGNVGLGFLGGSYSLCLVSKCFRPLNKLQRILLVDNIKEDTNE